MTTHFQLRTLMSCCNDRHEELCLLLKLPDVKSVLCS
nr:MAG TPA_asm: hypothetical protein [Caudoviricetes sp.]